jgi:hypothetical protein
VHINSDQNAGEGMGPVSSGPANHQGNQFDNGRIKYSRSPDKFLV